MSKEIKPEEGGANPWQGDNPAKQKPAKSAEKAEVH